MEKMTFIGVDGWERPVYMDTNGNLWKDVDPREESAPLLCAACNNEFYGEPDYEYHGAVEFIPGRAKWKKIRGREVIAL